MQQRRQCQRELLVPNERRNSDVFANEDPEVNAVRDQSETDTGIDHITGNAQPIETGREASDCQQQMDNSNQISCGTDTSDQRKAFSKRTFSTVVSERFLENGESVLDNKPMNRLIDTRKQIGTIVNDERVQGFLLSLIIINAILMGVATFPAVKENPNINSKFEIVDEIFLWIFTIEAAMQLIYHGWTVLKDGFLVFDLAIVALSWAMEGVKVARAFRIFRAFRLIARIDIMKNLIMAVFSVIPNLSGIFMLLSLVFYIFGVMFTSLYKDVSKEYDRTEQYFVGLPETLFTLFQMMTLDGWKTIFLQAYEEYSWSWVLFISFLVVTCFVFVNLMIAVICDAVQVMSDHGRAGLTGSDENEMQIERSKDPINSPRQCDPTASSLRHKLDELERQFDEVVMMQNELIAALHIVAKTRDQTSVHEKTG